MIPAIRPSAWLEAAAYLLDQAGILTEDLAHALNRLGL